MQCNKYVYAYETSRMGGDRRGDKSSEVIWLCRGVRRFFANSRCGENEKKKSLMYARQRQTKNSATAVAMSARRAYDRFIRSVTQNIVFFFLHISTISKLICFHPDSVIRSLNCSNSYIVYIVILYSLVDKITGKRFSPILINSDAVLDIWIGLT